MKKHFELSDDRSFSSREEVRRLQDRLLAEQIRYCRNNSPFYREKLAAFPDRDHDFDTLQELFPSEGLQSGDIVFIPESFRLLDCPDARAAACLTVAALSPSEAATGSNSGSTAAGSSSTPS